MSSRGKKKTTMAKISRKRAQKILVDLVLSGVIQIHTSEKEEYYTAA